MKKKWLIFMVFALCLVEFLSFMSAGTKNITIEYPPNVTAGQIFQINLTLINFSNDIYDVKIEVSNGSEDINQIWNGTSWISSCMSSCKYVYDIINTSIENSFIFLLNITSNYNGTANITTRIRDSSNNPITFSGYFINITPAQIILPTCTINTTCTNSSCMNGNITQTCTTIFLNCTNFTTIQNISCTVNSTNTTTKATITLQLNWTANEIINADEFNIKVNAFNLENHDYKLRIWIEFKDNTTIISDRYDENEKKWKSGFYFLNDFFSGSGNKTESVKLRLREDYTTFLGEVKILAKLQKGNYIVGEVNYTITILNKTESSNNASLVPETNSTNITATTDGGIIKLGSKTTKKINQTEDIKTETVSPNVINHS